MVCLCFVYNAECALNDMELLKYQVIRLKLISLYGRMWKGFLGSKLSSVDLIWFALATFVIAPNSLRFRLVKHLIVDPSGAKLLQTYAGIGAVSSNSADLRPVKQT